MIKINVELEFNEAWLESVVCSALEGGIDYWIDDGFQCSEIRNKKAEKGMLLVDRIAKGYSELLIRDEEDVIKEGTVWSLNRDTFARGFERYIKWCVNKGTMLCTDSSDIDADVADIIVQLGLFNEIIFG